MAEDRMALLDTLRKATADGDVDVLREGVRVLAQAIMEAEVAELTGVPKGERDPERRLTSRNGYRDRRWDTRVGSVELDPRIVEWREHKAVESTAHHHAGEEREDELEPAHRAAAGLTARTYPVGEPGVGVDLTSAPSCPKGAGGRGFYSADWAMPLGSGGRRPHSPAGAVGRARPAAGQLYWLRLAALPATPARARITSADGTVRLPGGHGARGEAAARRSTRACPSALANRTIRAAS